MAFLQVQFFSRMLNVASTINVILPEVEQGIGLAAAEDESLPGVLYLLHGYSDDHSIWMRRTSVERYAAEHRLAVVMPAVNHSYYTNEAQGERYWDYVSEELPQVVHTFFRLSKRPEDTYVAGLSMGGYGAMKMALAHPERFAAAASFSGAVDMATLVEQRENREDEYSRIFGNVRGVRGSGNDLYHLMDVNASAEHKPRLYVSCGTADFLYGVHGPFVTALREKGWDVTSFEKPGAVHEWGFWDAEIAKFIPWALKEK